jgi:hypothetical protein
LKVVLLSIEGFCLGSDRLRSYSPGQIAVLSGIFAV